MGAYGNVAEAVAVASSVGVEGGGGSGGVGRHETGKGTMVHCKVTKGAVY
jgi:hypothetical protein